MHTVEARPYRAIPTEVPGLDEILGGGLLEGGLYLLEGVAGAGKTLLASQICFSWARAGRRVVFITLIAESHGKLVQHLTRMRFFDGAMLGTNIQIMSGYQTLLDKGFRGLFKLLAEIAQQHNPALVVVDGFRTVREHLEPGFTMSAFIHELNTFLATTRCTGLLLAPVCGNEARPEHTLVDGLIELSRHTAGMRRTREVEVHKLRASDPILGRHLFSITDAGIRVFPRMESTVSRRMPQAAERKERLKFGIPTLDEMLHGGLMTGSTTSLLGAPGTGKTVLGLKFLEEGLQAGQPALYFGFYESPDRLVGKAEGLGIELERYRESGLLHIVWQPPLEYSLDELGYALLEAVSRHRIRRLVIDGIEGFRQSAVRPERMSQYMTALTTELRARGIETILTEETAHEPSDIRALLISALVENIILLRYVERDEQLHRLISILKLRESDYDSSIRRFRISSGGIVVEAAT